MQLDGREILSAVEIALYSPFLIAALAVCFRHGFKRAEGWIFLLLLCLIRLVGAACDISTHNSPSQGLYVTVAILDSIGISPLLLATLGILSRL
jgi:hypothetical protein